MNEFERWKKMLNSVGTSPKVWKVFEEMKGEIKRLSDILEHNSLPLYPCVDCGKEEQNPGLSVCGECYHKRITGHDY